MIVRIMPQCSKLVNSKIDFLLLHIICMNKDNLGAPLKNHVTSLRVGTVSGKMSGSGRG